MNIAIIPARGGSKRIPKKNIKNFCGYPMISYSIKAAQESKIFDRIIVSTDSNEIASIAKEHGADIPFLRPKDISDDFATTSDVMKHAINFLKEEYELFNSVCCIYATAPLIQKDDLVKGFEVFNTKKWSYVFSATSFPFPIQRAIKKLSEGGIEMFQPSHFNTRSQDLEEGYHDAGQFYFGSFEAWQNKEIFFQRNSEIIILPRWRVQDIDTENDWKNAEKLFQLINGVNDNVL